MGSRFEIGGIPDQILRHGGARVGFHTGWVISGCAGPSAARQVNLNKRTQPREPERAYLAIRHAPAG
jgi:hypothetical protein